MNAAYSRRSAAGGVVSGVQIASDIQILRNMARSNWGDDSGVTLWDAADKGGGGGPPPGGPPGGGGGGGSGGGGAKTSGGEAGGAAGAAGAAAAVPAAAVGGTKAASQHLQGTAAAKDAGPTTSDQASTAGESSPERPPDGSGRSTGDESPRTAEKPPWPAPEQPVVKPERSGEK